jgi:hypothetical protein
LAWVVACRMATACAGADALEPATSVCPVRAGARVSQIDIFDGDPAELAFLAPDDENKAPNTYTVKSIYDEGRYVTVRCHYGPTLVVVQLAKRIARCTFSGGDTRPALTCK